MGNSYEGEHIDVEIVKSLVTHNPALPRYLSHHLRNALGGLQAAGMRKDQNALTETIRHIVKDLEQVGL